jgi:transposase-like protein
MTKKSRVRDTLEFKKETVRLVKGRQTIDAVPRALGVVDPRLFNWLKSQRQRKFKGATASL